MSPDGDCGGGESVRNSEAQVLTWTLQREGTYYVGGREGTLPLGQQRGTLLLLSSFFPFPLKTRRAHHPVHLCLQSENQALFYLLVPLHCIQVAVKRLC